MNVVQLVIVKYTVFRKKHPLMFSFIPLGKMFRFPQSFQEMFRRKQAFHMYKS